MADRLDRVNQGLSRENLRLKSQFKSQEDDRKFIIKQLVAIKVSKLFVAQKQQKPNQKFKALLIKRLVARSETCSFLVEQAGHLTQPVSL